MQAVNVNSDYTAFDDNVVTHIQIPAKNKQRQALVPAVSMDAEQSCLLELAGGKNNVLWSKISHSPSPCNYACRF